MSSSTDLDIAAVRDLIAALRYPHPASPISPLSDSKVSAIVLRADTLLSDRGEIGEAGCGYRSAAIKSRTATMAKLVDKDIGVRPLVGNHTTVSAMRSPHVSEM